MEIGLAQLATLFIIVLGPFKVIGPFAVTTARADRVLRRQIARRAIGVSTAISLVVAGLGSYLMLRLNMSVPILTITMGFFLGHWALQNALAPEEQASPPPEQPTIELAIFPVSLPIIIPQQGIALLVIATDLQIEAYSGNGFLLVMPVILGVMGLNWLFMLAAPSLMKVPVFWMVLGRIIAVIACGLALQIIVSGLRAAGILT